MIDGRRKLDRHELEDAFPDGRILWDAPREDDDREAWLEDRRTRLGGTDVAGILGLSPYNTPHHVWAHKVGLELDDDDNLPMRLGRELEDLVADEFEREMGDGWAVADVPAPVVREDLTYLGGNPDGVVYVDGEGVVGGWEGKTTSDPDKFEDGVPVDYKAQITTYMAATGLEVFWVTVLIYGGWSPEVRTFRVERDQEDVETILQTARAFWTNHVQTRTPPPITAGGAAGAREVLPHHHDEADDEEVELGEEAAQLVEDLEDVKAQIDDLEDQKDAIQAELMEVLGERGRSGRLPDGRKVNYQLSRYLSKTTLEEEYPEIFEQCKKEKVDNKAVKRRDPEAYEAAMKTRSGFIRIY